MLTKLTFIAATAALISAQLLKIDAPSKWPSARSEATALSPATLKTEYINKNHKERPATLKTEYINKNQKRDVGNLLLDGAKLSLGSSVVGHQPLAAAHVVAGVIGVNHILDVVKLS